MATYEWNGHTIDVDFQPFARTAWLCAAFVVHVDGRRFLPELDGISLYTSTEFEFEDHGILHVGQVRNIAPMIFLPMIRYVVCVDGVEIAQDRQVLQRWYLQLLSFNMIIVLCYLVWLYIESFTLV